MISRFELPRPAATSDPCCTPSGAVTAARTRACQVTTLLLLAGALAVGGCKRTASKTTGATAEAVGAASTDSPVNPANLIPDSVVVYYFHGDRRCRTCMGIQQTIQTTVSERFAAETASGELAFREVNIDEPDNAHFVKEFDLNSSSMVVVAKSGEKTVKWENCTEIWPLAHDEAALTSYAEEQIRSYLELVRRT